MLLARATTSAGGVSESDQRTGIFSIGLGTELPCFIPETIPITETDVPRCWNEGRQPDDGRPSIPELRPDRGL